MSNLDVLTAEQLHDDLKTLADILEKNLNSLPQALAKQFPEPEKLKHLTVTVDNQVQPVDKVEIKNELVAKINNLSDLNQKFDELRKAVENSKTEEVAIKNSLVISNLKDVTELLEKLIEKDTEVNVSPQIKVDKVSIDNLPTRPSEAIAVRLSDGKKFISELTKVVASGGGIPSALIDNGNLKTTVSNTVTSEAPTYKMLIDDSVVDITYVGKAQLGSNLEDAVWQIAKLDTSSGLVKTWAGNAGFNQVWLNRSSLTYN